MIAVFVLAGMTIILLVNYHMRQQALIDAKVKARIILDHNLATHAYFSNHLKPKIFMLTEPIRDVDYFDPIWMSSTFAVREIEKNFKIMSQENYYYKECAINARSPENEADEYEQRFIHRLNEDPDLTDKSEIRSLDGYPYFIILRRGEVMEKPCLRCHSTPDQAPGGLVDFYGPERSFNRYEGEVVSAISIRIPLSAAYASANSFSLQLSVLLLLILFLIFLLTSLINRKLIFAPLNLIRNKTMQISEEETALGEEIKIPQGRELRELVTAFNIMSLKLRENMDFLEHRVTERTRELALMNSELTEALAQVKTLSGFLPICTTCKKIRDDQGYWNQIEEYIHKHSDAEFSHSACPDCVKKLYPEFADQILNGDD